MWVLIVFFSASVSHNLGPSSPPMPQRGQHGTMAAVVSTYDTEKLCHTAAQALGKGWGAVCLPMSSKPQG